jgi:hypothetical protein
MPILGILASSKSKLPAAPTIGTVTTSSKTAVSVPYTDNATGGSPITARTITSNPPISLSYSSTSSSPVAITGSFAQSTSYTFTITATNANGTSSPSNSSNSVTPYIPVYATITSLTYTDTGSTTGTLSFGGYAIAYWFFVGDGSILPSGYSPYTQYPISSPTNLVNLVSGNVYTVGIGTLSVDGQGQGTAENPNPRYLTFSKP